MATGAIASDYQRVRVEGVCARLGLTSLAFLWRQPQAPLLRRMLDGGILAVLVKVAALGTPAPPFLPPPPAAPLPLPLPHQEHPADVGFLFPAMSVVF